MSRMKSGLRGLLCTSFAVCAAMAIGASAAQASVTIKPNYEFKKAPMIQIPGDVSNDTNGASPVYNAPNAVYQFGFEGVSQYDGASFGRNFIPPDTMGAVGRAHYMETTNGAYAIFDKATGNRLSLVSDVAFWAAAGQNGANGDSRVMYNEMANRWIAISFGASTSDIQIAISNTDNALGPWQSVKFTGFAGGTADYPTLALDRNAVYIGTNNFKVGCSPANPAANAFCGTTLNVIPLDSLFNGGAPTVANMKQFVNTLLRQPSDVDYGFAVQGVNSRDVGTTGNIVANSVFFNDNITFDVNGLTSNSALGSTITAPGQYLNVNAMTDAGPFRQPSAAIAANRRVGDALDQRISSSVYEVNGRIYMVQTVNSLVNGDADGDFARIRYTVIDSATKAILDQGDIGTGNFDYYQGSIAVNATGQLVIGYNRSGNEQRDLDGDGLSDGNVTFMAAAFTTLANGTLQQIGSEFKLKVSLTDDYHNGSIFGNPAAGRQRWGDYSQVSVDPDDPNSFWLIGEFAREYNLPQFGHPNGTGGSRWGTWIAKINIGNAVPEPATWAMLLLGFGMVGSAYRRRRTQVSFSAA